MIDVCLNYLQRQLIWQVGQFKMDNLSGLQLAKSMFLRSPLIALNFRKPPNVLFAIYSVTTSF